MAVLVKARALTKSFAAPGGRFVALDRVDFDVVSGRTTGLVGESGSGKSTLVRALLWLDPPDSGTVEFDGTDLGSLDRRALRRLRTRMQIVFQDSDSAFDPRRSVGQSLEEGLVNQGVRSAERSSRVRKILDLVGIPVDRTNDYPHRFSGGQKQRLSLARSLVLEPELLVLDEPVSALDVSVQAQVVNLLVDLKAELKLTYLFVSHDLDLVAYLSDSVAVVQRGTIVEAGPTEALLANPLHSYTKELLAARPPFRRSEVSLPW